MALGQDVVSWNYDIQKTIDLGVVMGIHLEQD